MWQIKALHLKPLKSQVTVEYFCALISNVAHNVWIHLDIYYRESYLSNDSLLSSLLADKSLLSLFLCLKFFDTFRSMPCLVSHSGQTKRRAVGGSYWCVASTSLKINFSHCDKVLNFTVGWCLPSDNSGLGGVKPIKMQKQVEKTLFSAAARLLSLVFIQQTPTVEYSPGVTQARRSIVPL